MTFAIGESPVGESHIGELPATQQNSAIFHFSVTQIDKERKSLCFCA
jgi:hypothetical protein